MTWRTDISTPGALRFTGGLLASACLAAASCAGVDSRVPSVSDAMLAAPPAHSKQSLENGRRLLLTACNRCHRVYEPASRDVGAWDSVLPAMAHKAGLSEADASDLRGYIMAAVQTAPYGR
ncbi:MAG: hypothetical protein JSR77_11770 [Planctomycetes bacterium]|nr:hypothetical protein [Planctomycetota bacterium]